jgi:hypothetical protein
MMHQSYEQEELEQLKVNYDNEMRNASNKYHPNDPEILQHVIYDKSKKDHGGYSPLHTCMHDAAHVQLRGPEVMWKANTHAQNHCDYEAHKALNTCATQKDNVAFVQPCAMTTFTDNTDPSKQMADATITTTSAASSSSPNVLDSSSYNPPETHAHNTSGIHTLNTTGGHSVRSFHENAYGERPTTCVHTRDRLPRNPRNIYEPRRTRVLYTLNNSF